jgi:hypothetical protein
MSQTCFRDKPPSGAKSDLLVISLVTAGQKIVGQDGRQATLEPGDIFIVDGPGQLEPIGAWYCGSAYARTERRP